MLLQRAKVFLCHSNLYFFNYPMFEKLMDFQIEKQSEKRNYKSFDDIGAIQEYQKQLVQKDEKWVFMKVILSY